MLALALAAVLPTACGGGGEGEPSPTPAPPAVTAEERAAAETILRAASLPGEDLPQGFTFQEERFLTNEESAAEESHYAGVEDLNRWGQILRYEVTYQREIPPTLTGATISLAVTTVLYRDEAGARNALDFERLRASSPESLLDTLAWPAYSELNVGEASVSPISVGGIGDDRATYQMEVPGSLPDIDSELKFFGQLLFVRRGKAIGSLAMVAVGSPHPVKELEALARTLDEHMKDALELGAPET